MNEEAKAADAAAAEEAKAAADAAAEEEHKAMVEEYKVNKAYLEQGQPKQETVAAKEAGVIFDREGNPIKCTPAAPASDAAIQAAPAQAAPAQAAPA